MVLCRLPGFRTDTIDMTGFAVGKNFRRSGTGVILPSPPPTNPCSVQYAREVVMYDVLLGVCLSTGWMGGSGDGAGGFPDLPLHYRCLRWGNECMNAFDYLHVSN